MADDVLAAIARLEVKVDDLRDRLPDHETRLRNVERWMYGIPPTALLALVGLLTGVRG